MGTPASARYNGVNLWVRDIILQVSLIKLTTKESGFEKYKYSKNTNIRIFMFVEPENIIDIIHIVYLSIKYQKHDRQHSIKSQQATYSRD
jgi:hypothetical protein